MAERLNEETFDSFALSGDGAVLVDFYRDGCIPCRRVAPLLAKAEPQYADRLKIARVNIDQNPALTERYSIEAAPTLLLLRDGQEISRHRGVIDKDTLKAFIEAAI